MGKTKLEYEEKYYNEGYEYILGCDEAGRGPMAGELVVAGVIFPKGFYDERIDDSKTLSYKKREELYDIIINNALFYNIEIISVEDVDKYNVYQASKMGMEKCVKKANFENMFTLSDAMPLDNCGCLPLIKGDKLSMTIAGASILAKVTRDRLMEEHDKLYPEYGFKDHKGYVTKKHKEMLEKYGPCEIHRKSFKPVSQQINKQLELF